MQGTGVEGGGGPGLGWSQSTTGGSPGIAPFGHWRTRSALEFPRAITLFPNTACWMSQYPNPTSWLNGRAAQPGKRMMLLSMVMLVTVPLGGPKHKSQMSRPPPPPESSISLFRQVMESIEAPGWAKTSTPEPTFAKTLLRTSTGPTFSPGIGSKDTAAPQLSTRQFSTRTADAA